RLAVRTQTPQARRASELAHDAARTATEAASLASAAVAHIEELATQALAKAALENNESARTAAAGARASAQTAHAAFNTLAKLVAQMAIDHIDSAVGAANHWYEPAAGSKAKGKRQWN